MMAAVFLSYAAVIWLIFEKLRLIRLSLPLALVLAAVGPIFAFYVVVSMNNFHPSSPDQLDQLPVLQRLEAEHKSDVMFGGLSVTLTKRIAACLLGAASALGGFAPVIAAEGGHGVYLLGLKGPGAGFAPPPGIYFSNNLYYYNASASANRLIPTVGGEAIANVKAKVWLSLPSILWSTPVEVLGGRLMFSALIPVGGPSIDAGATVSSRFVNPVLTPARNDSVSTYGDPAVSAQLGWKAGNFHWTAGVSTFLPIGDYKEGALANVANHRLAADVNGALTWLDPNIGLDLSVAAGVTFNKQNEATKYRTGNEFHVEWAAVQNLTKEFSIGAVGYYYQQLSGDGGPGATLGAFKGEVAAVGGTIGYTFKAGELPISTRLRVYREFDVKNRVQGTAAFFTVSMPLHVAAASR